jgi:hypothetical protein
LWIRTHFFRIRIRIQKLFFSDSDTDSDSYCRLIFWPQMVPLIAFICVLKPVGQRIKIFNRKTYDFSFSSVWFLIFHKNFHPTTVSESESISVSESELFFRIRIQPKHSDYFGFGSTTLDFRHIFCDFIDWVTSRSATKNSIFSQFSMQPDSGRHWLFFWSPAWTT